MQIMTNTQELSYIPITAEMVPCTLEVKLTDKTYRMAFKYNESGGFFTVDLSVPVFEQFSDERYPLPLIIPAAVEGDQIEHITYDNFGDPVKLWLLPREE